MTRRADLWRSVSLALVVQISSFQPSTVPFVGKAALRGGRESATGRHRYLCSCTAEPGQGCRHPGVQHDGSASSKVWGDGGENGDGRRVDERDKMGLEKTDNPLVEYFARHDIESAEIVPAHLNDSTVDLIVDGDASITKTSVNVKTVIFQAKGKPFAAVMHRELVADPVRMAQHFRLPTRQITLAGTQFVEELTGFSVGTIPPLGHRTPLPTLVDTELLEYSTVIGGGGRRGFHSRISVYDLVKATAASVILLARPKIDANGHDADIPILSINSTTTLTAMDPPAISVVKSSSSKRNDVNGQSLRRLLPGDGSSPVGEGVGDRTVSMSSDRNDALLDRRARITAAVDPARREEAEDRLRVVEAAMQTVAAALSLVSVSLSEALLKDNGDGQGRDCDRTLSPTEIPCGRRDVNDLPATTASAAAPSPEISRGRWDAVPPPNAAASAGELAADGFEVGPSGVQVCERTVGELPIAHTPDASPEHSSSSSDDHQGYSENLDPGMAETPKNSGSTQGLHLRSGNLEEGPGEKARSSTDNDRAAKEAGDCLDEMTAPAEAETVPHSAALTSEEDGRGGGEGGDALWSVAGTPTLDAISGDVHLVALVAGMRSLTRLLHFVDLVPPTNAPAKAAGNQSCLVRKAWMIPGMVQDHPPRPVQVQLIMGKALVDRLGEEDARVAMRGVKRGQLLYVTGRPTRDTRLRFFGDGGGRRKKSTAISGKPDGDVHGNHATYDLVCCSVRMLEDAPAVEPEMVGKGDDWSGGEDWLKMDLDEERAVAYVDSSRGVREMGAFLREALVDPLRNAAGVVGGGTFSKVESRLAMAIDCEWRPGTRAGAPQNPVSLMQLAVGDRVFIVDMLHVCRANSEGGRGDHSEGGTRGMELTETEALLDEAIGEVLRAPRVVKVGAGPKADFQSLVRSFPQLPCFRRVCGVVNLIDLARDAASLKKTPAEEKGSLSRLSNLVLGKPLDKSEQCSDWGTRPLSRRQKRYAALDARATLRLHQKLAPEVPAERIETLFSTFFYDDRAHGVVATQTLPSYASYATSATTPRAGRKRRRAGVGRRGRGGGGGGGRSRQDRDDRRKMLAGVEMVEVSEVALDVEGLERDWLGRAMPGVTKEGVVRACISLGSKPPVSVLRFDRHLSFVEFQNGYALLMNCGGSAKEREHASGFLDENGSLVAWYLQGRLAPERASHSFGDADSSSSSSSGRNTIGRFLERIEALSGASRSISGDLPDGDSTALSDAMAATAAAGGGVAEGEIAPRTSPDPDLVLFARSKGRPFVYCGAVDCVAQEYFAWSNSGSSRLGAVRFTLALRGWRRASGRDVEGNDKKGDNDRPGEENAFRDIVREGLKLKSAMYS